MDVRTELIIINEGTPNEAEILLFTLICFANAHDIDLDKAIESSIKKVTYRDADRFD